MLAGNISWLHHLVTMAQLTERQCLVDPAVVSDDKDEMYFLEQWYLGLNDDEIKEMFECYLILSEIPHPDSNP